MFFVQLAKEIKVFFTNKGNLLFTFVMPLLLITIFSFALEDYISAEYGTFTGGKVYYCAESDIPDSFMSVASRLENCLGVSFEQLSDYEQACRDVEASKAYGAIRIKNDGYEYFRSTFNEPEDGKLVRTLFIQMTEGGVSADEFPEIHKTGLNVNKLDSKAYYTFAGLSFSIMFMGLLVAFMVYSEREFGTIERIKLSDAGVLSMIASKVITGIICGCVMIGASYLYSTFALNVNWGSKTPLIFVLLLCLVLFSAVFGSVVGMVGKNKTMCQSTVMMTAMLCGYLGGSITPLYLLENTPVLNWIIKISPLYWENQAIISLYNGITDEKLLYSLAVLIGLSVVLAIAGTAAGKKVK